MRTLIQQNRNDLESDSESKVQNLTYTLDSYKENNDNDNMHIFVPMNDGEMQRKGRSMQQNYEGDEITDGATKPKDRSMHWNYGNEMTDGKMQSKGQSMHLHNYDGNDTRVNNWNNNDMQSKGRSMYLHNYEGNNTRVNNRKNNEGYGMRVSNNDYHNIDNSNGGTSIRILYKFDGVPFCV